MKAARKKRLLVILFILFGASLTVFLVLGALRENLNHFYTPTEVVAGKASDVKSVRLGGMVKAGSLERADDSLKLSFLVTDFASDTKVIYEGILPDLFREGQGVVVIGQLNTENTLVADQVLAKHDEKYMPPEAQKALEKSGYGDVEGL